MKLKAEFNSKAKKQQQKTNKFEMIFKEHARNNK